MKGRRKQQAPSEFEVWVSNANEEWRPSYNNMPGNLKALIRDRIFAEQRGLCVYCGEKLSLSSPGKSYHVEHFRPQSRYPELDVDFSNLFLSCGHEKDGGRPSSTCGSIKADWFDEEYHVQPAYPDCTARFRFMLNGNVVPAREGDLAAQQMIDRLKLDHPELRKDRENILLQIDADELSADDFWDATTQLADSFAHVAFQHAGRQIP